ncbi:hypothetical protein LPJ66_000850 [Kickxella alabastrina]|uniref:Uncharacterized protein n=1 Tax=Kickxella alabastrina TaxID=61397 RepID=A0ACC1IUZ3_9FUNG|nr:hypothetical protein LPJ66_000850 [Kickxella alabastrina]
MNPEIAANHPPAEFKAGRRMSQSTGVPVLNKEPVSPNKDEEGDSTELIHQSELDKKYLYEQVKKQQEHATRNQKYTNAELNRGPDPVRNGRLRQPSQFPSGIPKDTKMAMREAKN